MRFMLYSILMSMGKANCAPSCVKCRGKSEQCEKVMDLTVEIERDIGTPEKALA